MPPSPADRGLWVAQPPEPKAEGRVRRWLPWSLAGLVVMLSIIGLSVQTSALGDARDEVAAQTRDAESKAKEIATLNGQIDELESETSDLNTANSDLRATSTACQQAAELAQQVLPATSEWLDGRMSKNAWLRLIRQSTDASDDCDARFSALGS